MELNVGFPELIGAAIAMVGGGWKLWGKLEAGQVRSLVCTINPFTKYN